MQTPKVSVIIPCYNVANYVEECLKSIQSQTLKEIEIICIDDLSTDNTLNILNQYAKDDHRIHVIVNKEKSGPAKSRNAGMDQAAGDYLVFMDSDDYYPEDKTLEKLYTAVCQNNVYIAGGNLTKLTPTDEYTEENFTRNEVCLFEDKPFSYGFTLFIYNREFLFKNNIRFPNYQRFEDPPFFVRAMVLAKRYYTLTDSVYVYRVSYKKVNWTERIVLDVLNGISDNLAISQEHKMYKLYVEQIRVLWDEVPDACAQNSAFESVQNKIKDILNNTDTAIFSTHLEKKLSYQEYYCSLIKKDKQLYKKWKPYIKWPSWTKKIFQKKKISDTRRNIYLFGVRVFSYQKKFKPKTSSQTSLLNLSKTPVYYYVEDPNFGDLLNENLMDYFHLKYCWANEYQAQLICIGSLLQGSLKNIGKEQKCPLHVFGSGFIIAPGTIKEEFCRPMVFHALRGKLSQKRCEKITGQNLDNVPLGDPGLLIKYIFPDIKLNPVYDVGIVCHFVDKDSPLLKNIQFKKLKVKFIDVSQKPNDFIPEVAQCKFILSSAMHGLICADSLGIPSKHIILSDKVVGGEYKFQDYYSVFKDFKYRPIYLKNTTICDADIEQYLSEYTITSGEIDEICQKLIAAFPKKEFKCTE